MNIILAGVGGQGILTTAYILDYAAIKQRLFIKQSEIHGMSQRGGAVYSHLRLSGKGIHSETIPEGECDLLISTELLESVRYLPFLKESGMIITSSEEIKTGREYPKTGEIRKELENCGLFYRIIDTDNIIKKLRDKRVVNTAMAGAASHFTGLNPEYIRDGIKERFSGKGKKTVELNLKAFDLGLG